MYKKLNSWAVYVAICVTLSACSDGDNLENIEDESQSSTELDSESQAIIDKYKDMRIWYGRWNLKGPTYRPDFIFYSDGTCEMVTKHLNEPAEYKEGVWSYAPGSKLLSTTCNDWTWTVNILPTPTEWSGSVNGTSWSYERSGTLDPNEELLIGKWMGTNRNTKLSVTFKANNEYIFTKADSCFYGRYKLNIFYSTNHERYYCDVDLFGDLSGNMDFSQLNGYNIAFRTDKELGRRLTPYEYSTVTSYDFIYSDFAE